MAVCVAVIAKENYPLYIKTAPADNELKFYYTVHTSLDVVEEKISSVGKSANDLRELYLGLLYPTEDYKVMDGVRCNLITNDLRELYLGLLYPTEDYKVYGYVTNTKVKFVIVMESSNTNLRDTEIRSMFRKLHTAYIDMLCNPFYTPGETVTSKAFNDVVIGMMEEG